MAGTIEEKVTELVTPLVESINPWVGKIPCRRAWQPTPVFLPGEHWSGLWGEYMEYSPHGQRSLAGYSLQGRRVGCD